MFLLSLAVAAAGVVALVAGIRRNNLVVVAVGLVAIASLAFTSRTWSAAAPNAGTVAHRVMRGAGLMPARAPDSEAAIVRRALASGGLPACGPGPVHALRFRVGSPEADAFLDALEAEGFAYQAHGHSTVLMELEPGILGGNTLFTATGATATVAGGWTVDSLGGGRLYACDAG